MPKKRKSKKSSLKIQETHLSEALKDLNRELKDLAKNKKSLEKELKNNKINLVKTQNKEKKLRDAISKLIAREEAINEKREYILNKIGKLKDKISQVSKIKDELRSI